MYCCDFYMYSLWGSASRENSPGLFTCFSWWTRELVGTGWLLSANMNSERRRKIIIFQFKKASKNVFGFPDGNIRNGCYLLFCLFKTSKCSLGRGYFIMKGFVRSLISTSTKIISDCLLALLKPIHDRCQISDITWIWEVSIPLWADLHSNLGLCLEATTVCHIFTMSLSCYPFLVSLFPCTKHIISSNTRLVI